MCIENINVDNINISIIIISNVMCNVMAIIINDINVCV